MDDLLAAVVGAISQAEREAAKEQGEPNPEMREGRGRQEHSSTPTMEKDRQAEARRRASIFLQGMAITGGGLQREGGTHDYARRPGKEPMRTASQTEGEATPPEQKEQHRTHPTRPYGGAGPSRFWQATQEEGGRGDPPAFQDQH